MKISEKRLRAVVRGVINEFGMKQTRTMPSGDDRRFAVSALPNSSVGGDVSQTDAVKLMSASTGFFQTLVDAIRFGFLTREEVNRICSSLEKGCEDNFKSLIVSMIITRCPPFNNFPVNLSFNFLISSILISSGFPLSSVFDM